MLKLVFSQWLIGPYPRVELKFDKSLYEKMCSLIGNESFRTSSFFIDYYNNITIMVKNSLNYKINLDIEQDQNKYFKPIRIHLSTNFIFPLNNFNNSFDFLEWYNYYGLPLINKCI